MNPWANLNFPVCTLEATNLRYDMNSRMELHVNSLLNVLAHALELREADEAGRNREVRRCGSASAPAAAFSSCQQCSLPPVQILHQERSETGNREGKVFAAKIWLDLGSYTYFSWEHH